MKKIISLLLAASLVFSICITTNAYIGKSENIQNVLRTQLESSKSVAMFKSNDAVEDSDRFSEATPNALSLLVDGKTSIYDNFEVHGALDWNPPRYLGAEFKLKNSYYCDEAVIYSSGEWWPNNIEFWRVYASENQNDLYSPANLMGTVEVNGMNKVQINKSVKYIAFICTDYTGGMNPREVELWTSESEEVSEPPTESLTVIGNRIVNEKGETVILKGVNITELSWSVYGDGDPAYLSSEAELSLLEAFEWGCNAVRLAVNPEFYLNGGSHNGIYRTAEEYRSLTDRLITSATDRGIAVILDCHSYHGVTNDVIEFWKIAAPKYNNNRLVLYGLLNEPTSDWKTYYEGGILNGESVIGIPNLLDIVRSYSDNIAVIGGIDFAFDLSCISKTDFAAFAAKRASALGISANAYCSKYSLNTEERRGRGIILDSHIYSFKPFDWDYYILNASEEYPILIGEFGPGYTEDDAILRFSSEEIAYLQRIFRYIQRNDLNFTAWGMNAWPYLTKDRISTPFGKAVKDYINFGTIPDRPTENLLRTQLNSSKGIAVYAKDGKIENSNRFSEARPNALSYSVDGKAYEFEVWGDLDGVDSQRYIGAQYTLNNSYYCSEAIIYSGDTDSPESWRVYASDSLSDLYSVDSLTETIECRGDAKSIVINKNVKYISFVCTDYNGVMRVKEFELWLDKSAIPKSDIVNENLLNTQFKACRPISAPLSGQEIVTDYTFYNNTQNLGEKISRYLIDGNTSAYYNISQQRNRRLGIEYELNGVYAANEIKLTAGSPKHPEKYIIYASASLDTLYSNESIVENLNNNFTGTLSFKLDRSVKYVAILSDGYINISELELYGYIPGDCNIDRRIDSADLIILIKSLLGSAPLTLNSIGDTNFDGVTDIRDMVRLKKNLAAK